MVFKKQIKPTSPSAEFNNPQIPKWAKQCARKNEGKPSNHYKEGRCNCIIDIINEDSRGCKAHCKKCHEFISGNIRKEPPQPPTPYTNKKARRHREAKSEAEEKLDVLLLSDDDSEVEAGVADKEAQTIETNLLDPFSLRGIARFFQIGKKYIPEPPLAADAEDGPTSQIVQPKETAKKLKQVASKIVKMIVNTVSEYGNIMLHQVGSKLAVDMTKMYVAEKDGDEDNDDELILFSLRSLFASNNGDSKDDLYYCAFHKTEPFTNDGEKVLQQRDGMANACLKIMESQKEGSNEFRTARAIIVKGVDKKDTDKIRNDRTGHRVFGAKSRKAGKKDFTTATVYSAPLDRYLRTVKRISDESLEYALTCMLDTENVGLWSWGEKIVKTRTHGNRLRGSVNLPKIFRRKSVQDIYGFYKVEVKTSPARPIGFTLFTQILSAIVSGDSKMLRAVDYVTSLLLNDCCNLLLEIIKVLIGDQNPVKKKELEYHLEVVRNFLKVQYPSHARKVDGVCTHGLQYGLEKPEDYADKYVSDDLTASGDEVGDADDEDEDGFLQNVPEVDVTAESDGAAEEEDEGYGENENEVSDDNNSSHNSTQCDACRFPFFFLSELEAAVSAQHKERFARAKAAARKKAGEDGHHDEDEDEPNFSSDDDENEPGDGEAEPSNGEASVEAYVTDALKVINQCKLKFALYMAHKQRVAQQQGEIREIDGRMRSEVEDNQTSGTIIVIIIDWKMKFENIAKQDSTIDHYGKRGMSWHGCFAYFYQWNKEEKRVEKVVIKIDQILDTDALQNGDAVLSMFEAFLTAIESDARFSHLKTTILQADNAACYHDKAFVFGVAFLNKMRNRKIRIERKIHTETQDGKSLLDAHFARGTKQVVKYLKTSSAAENKRIGTPEELAKALAWNGGIPNSAVLLVAVDRDERLPAFNHIIHGCSEKALEYFSRANEIEFLDGSEAASKLDLTDEASWAAFSFDIRVWTHSGVGTGAHFRCKVGNGECLHIKGDSDEWLNFEASHDESDGNNSIVDEPLGYGFEPDDLDDFEDMDSDAEDEELLDDVFACYFDDIEEWQSKSFGDTSPLSAPTFSLNESLSGVQIVGMSSFGALTAKVVAADVDEELPTDGVHDYGIQNPSRAALPRALHMVDFLAANSSIKISGGDDDKLEIYKLATDFKLDEKQFERGWARRPLKGTLYGESNMTAQYKAEIFDWVKKGNENKSNKLNPRQMHLRLKADHKCFSVPSEQEIRTVIGPILEQLKELAKKKSKKQSNDENQEETEDEEQSQHEEQDDPNTIKALEWCANYLKQKVHQVGWEQMKPKTVVERMWNLLLVPWPRKKFDQMKYNNKFSALKSARKKRHEIVRKKAIV